MLAAGYAEADPEKAFPILESTILRANDTINAFVKVAEFIDTNEEMIADGEVQVGMFGGSMIRDLTGELGMASGTIKSLVKSDFEAARGSFDQAPSSEYMRRLKRSSKVSKNFRREGRIHENQNNPI